MEWTRNLFRFDGFIVDETNWQFQFPDISFSSVLLLLRYFQLGD